MKKKEIIKVPKSRLIAFRVTQELYDKIKEQAEKEHRLLTHFIEHALLTYLKKQQKP